jgi:hypothetical protein
MWSKNGLMLARLKIKLVLENRKHPASIDAGCSLLNGLSGCYRIGGVYRDWFSFFVNRAVVNYS